jgi:uncharacterized NAD(P)/FAD-binding protein YdhS
MATRGGNELGSIMERIAIIGGGAAGAAVVGEFLRRSDSGELSLTWFTGRASAPGRGAAYSTECDQHLLNVRAANMGLFADDVGGFARYVQTLDPTSKASEFLPRSLFGDYVEQTIGRLRMLHAAGCPLEVLAVEAAQLRSGDGNAGYRVKTDDGHEIGFDGVVLALGAPPALPLPYVQGSAIASGRYLLDPWTRLRSMEAPGTLAVIGAGLTGTDIILKAAQRWPDARIVSISRHGRLPGSHSDEPAPPYDLQGDLLETLRAQTSIRQRMRALREAIEDAPDWRAVIDGLRSANVELWQSLDLEERARFLRHVRWAWELARHRMAPAAAAAIARLQASGRLELLAGRIRCVAGSKPVVLSYRHRNSGEIRNLDADLAVQTTGFQPLTEATPHRLLRHLLKDGLVRIDELGLGLDADTNGSVFRVDGRALPGVRALGTLLRGTFWECTALPEIRTAAAKIVRELPRELRRIKHRQHGIVAPPVTIGDIGMP